MPSDVDNLKARRSVVIAQLVTIPATPNTSVDGESVDWAGLRKSLTDELTALNDLIQRLGGPFKISQVRRR